MERFGIPGKTLLGSDSHTPAAGSLGMLAIGAGGLEVSLAMAGEPFYIIMPKVWGVKLIGSLPDWVSAKDVILEMLRRHNVSGGVGKIIEYYGPGLDKMTAMDRHVIANMGAELGATTTVFPSDGKVREFLKKQGRESDWICLKADEDAEYDEHEEIDMSKLEPLIALPSSPGNVVPVREVAGREIYQSYVGSSANPGLRDFSIVALMIEGAQVHDRVSLDINPTSRQMLENMIALGVLEKLIHSGARLHQAGCNGCIGMGQAPATGRISLRTVPRNFPGRSGTKEDSVYLCSPETAAASALKGVITDPRTLGVQYPRFEEPEKIAINTEMLIPPAPKDQAVQLEKGPNIKPLPDFNALPENVEGSVLLKVGDNISTDEIMPAGAKVLPYRSNIAEISKFAFSRIDESYYQRSLNNARRDSCLVAGENYGQGSSREHAAIAPRYLGLHMIIAKSFARIHMQNLINFGILPLAFVSPDDWDDIDQGDILEIQSVRLELLKSKTLTVANRTKNHKYKAVHSMSFRQTEIVLKGGMINLMRHNKKSRNNPALMLK
jgi:aconitate hydratase